VSIPPSKNIVLPTPGQISVLLCLSHPRGGASAIVTERWDGMRWTRQHGVRLMSQGELILVSDGRCARRAMLQRFRQNFGRPHTACRGVGGGSCVRRSRVVLASVADAKSAEARFCPTGWTLPLIRETTVTKRNSSPGRARRKPLKPFACGNAGSSGGPVVTTVCYYRCTRAAGATERPAFPTPSRGGRFQNSGRACRENTKLRLMREHAPTHSSSSPARAGDPVFQRRR
jgi:hypothetical protein